MTRSLQPDRPSGRRLTIVDDDLLSREVLSLLAAEAGFEVAAFESGEAALESLDQSPAAFPDCVLADMQMPGLSGDSLARLLRAACGPSTILVAMSGTAVPSFLTQSFDGFLLKPFAIEDLLALCATLASPEAAPDASAIQPAPAMQSMPNAPAILNQAIYAAFAQSMSRDQVRQLYTMCLDDAESRIGTMRKALAAGDSDAWRRAAHSIKGGCGMVGALELAGIAARMEANGPETVDHIDPLKQFLSASARLRRILDAQLT